MILVVGPRAGDRLIALLRQILLDEPDRGGRYRYVLSRTNVLEGGSGSGSGSANGLAEAAELALEAGVPSREVQQYMSSGAGAGAGAGAGGSAAASLWVEGDVAAGWAALARVGGVVLPVRSDGGSGDSSIYVLQGETGVIFAQKYLRLGVEH